MFEIRTQQDIEDFARSVFGRFEQSGITHIVGLSRGGIIPAVYVSYYFDVPMIITNYSSPKGNGWYPQAQIEFLPDANPINPNSVVLIIDEDCDSGRTLQDLSQFFKYRGITAYTATVNERDASVFKPTYSWKIIPSEVTAVYPWNIDCEEG